MFLPPRDLFLCFAVKFTFPHSLGWASWICSLRFEYFLHHEEQIGSGWESQTCCWRTRRRNISHFVKKNQLRNDAFIYGTFEAFVPEVRYSNLNPWICDQIFISYWSEPGSCTWTDTYRRFSRRRIIIALPTKTTFLWS